MARTALNWVNGLDLLELCNELHLMDESSVLELEALGTAAFVVSHRTSLMCSDTFHSFVFFQIGWVAEVNLS